MWVGDSVYFLSDRDGVSNVWSYDLGTKKLAQVTTFTDFDVKTLDGGGDAVVFEQAGYIHELDPKTGRAHVVNMAAGDFPWMMPRWDDVTARMTEHRPLAHGQARRGRGARRDLHHPRREGRHPQHHALERRRPSASPRGRATASGSRTSPTGRASTRWSSNRRTASPPPREIAIKNAKHYYTPSWSPDSKKILFTDTDFNVWVMDVASGQPKLARQRSLGGPARTLNPSWSPDSKWVAYATRLNTLYRAIFVANVETGEKKQVTDGLADAMFPVWDASGKYLWFLASTDFGLRSQWLDMTSYDREETFGLYLAVLKKGEASPLLPESDEDKGAPVERRARQPRGPMRRGATGRRRRRGARRWQIDFDGLQQRIVAVARRARAPVLGVAGRRHRERCTTSRRPTRAAARGAARCTGTSSATARPRSSCQRRRVRRQRRRQEAALSHARAGWRPRRPARRGGADSGRRCSSSMPTRRPPTAGQGKLDVTLRMNVDPKAEFTQMFNEGWRNQRDYLYVPNMHGADWPKVKQMYAALLPYAMHRADLTYLIDMMGAEIAIGHSYVRGGALPEMPPSPGGLLGADFAIENSRYRITRIYDNESWNPDLRAPLAAPGVNVSVGDYVLAVNGVELTAPDNIYRLLDGTANRQTVLT